MRQVSGWVWVVLAGVVSAVVPSLAMAQPTRPVRLAVDSFDGPRAAILRNQLEDALTEAGHAEFVSDDELRSARRHYRRKPAGAARDRAVGKRLHLDGYVRGTVTSGDNWTLEVTIVDAQNDLEVGSHVWSARDGKGLSIVRQTAALHLGDLLAKLVPKEVPAWYSGDGENDDAEAVADKATDAAPEGDTNADDVYPWLRVALLGGVLHRSLHTTATVLNNGRLPGSTEATLTEERSYESAGIGHVEGGIEAEFFPGAMGDSQPFPYVGVVGSLRHSVFLSTGACKERNPVSAPCTSADRFDIKTSQMDLYGGLRGRYRLFGRGPRSFEVTLDGGIGLFSFTLDRNDLLEMERFSVVPPFTYTSIRTTIGASYGFTDEFRLFGSAGYHFGLGIGRDAREIWGVDSEGGSGLEFGLEGRLDLSRWILDGLFVGLQAQYFTYQSTIQGQTSCVNVTACNEATDRWEPWPSASGDPNQVTGGIKDPVTDHYVRVSLAVGYAL